MQPNNYILPSQGNPFESALGGYKAGLGIQQIQQQQAQADQQAQVIRALVSNPNPTAEDYARATLAVPGMREQFKQSWDMHSSAQQQSSLAEISQVHAALTNGQPQYAVDLLNRRVEALKNSGGPKDQIKAAEDMAKVIESNPQFAKAVVGMKLASIPGGDKVLENLGKLGTEQRAQELQPAAVAKAGADARTAVADATLKEAQVPYAAANAQADATKKAADATTAGVQAKYAERGALLDLEKKGWDITHIKADIDIRRESNRIAAMNAAISREGNLLKQQELKLKVAETQQKMDEKVREKVGEAESGAAAIDNMLNTIERIKVNPKLDSVLGSIQGRLPAVLSDDASDAIALIETLGSQAFLAQIPSIKGMGQLSDAEGKKLQAALTNLGRVQSEKQFRANLDDAARLLKLGRENLSRKTGVPLPAPNTPAAPGSRPPIDSFFK